MSTLLRENILQLANRLQQKQQMMLYSDNGEVEDSQTAIDGIFNGGERADSVKDSPPPSQSHTDSEQSPPLPSHPTLISALTSSSTSSSPLLPPYTSSSSGGANSSPWIRNAGRKKSHPVWEFFRDLKGENGTSDGSSSVLCLHCDWSGDDRSPNNLRTHLKKNHTHDGIFQRFSEKLAQTPTQPYVKRVRAGGILHQNQGHQGGEGGSINLNEMIGGAFNFLDSIPRMDEVINITARFTSPTDQEDEPQLMDTTNELTSSGDTRSSSSPSTSDPPSAHSPPPPSSTNPFSPTQLNSIMMAANPLLYMSALANVSSSNQAPPSTTPTPTPSTPSFALIDPSCISLLMKMAVDLDLTMSYHKRRGEAEVAFESNRTAEKSGGRGKIVSLSDLGKDMRITERVNGSPTETEVWTKTDLQQFHWAIRGKCMKVLK